MDRLPKMDALNRFLASVELPAVTEPKGFGLVIDEMGRRIDGHEHFRSLLGRIEPEQRYFIYDLVRRSLRFSPKSLDVYVHELGESAEIRQLPTVGEGGRLEPYKSAEISTV